MNRPMLGRYRVRTDADEPRRLVEVEAAKAKDAVVKVLGATPAGETAPMILGVELQTGPYSWSPIDPSFWRSIR